MTKRLQCIRKSKRAKPIDVLRFHALVDVVPVVKDLKRVLLFHPKPIWMTVTRKFCRCRTDKKDDLVQCGTCLEWFHYGCVDEDVESLNLMDDFMCGWCKSPLSDKGKREWKFKRLDAAGKGRRKVPKVKARKDSKTPRALQLLDEPQELGPRSWDAVCAEAAVLAKQINQKDKDRKIQANRLVKKGGHHVVDQMGFGGVVPRNVDAELIADLAGAGLLDGPDSSDEDEASGVGGDI